MQRTLLLACLVVPFATDAMAQGSCSQGVRIVSAYYFEGRHTASGQRFDPNGLTAAHRTFPFGTRLVVINPHNGKSVTVTINDRGPFVRGVTLDLSLGAAKVIGMRGTGAVCMARLGTVG
jgi:rare lipoprotein A